MPNLVLAIPTHYAKPIAPQGKWAIPPEPGHRRGSGLRSGPSNHTIPESVVLPSTGRGTEALAVSMDEKPLQPGSLEAKFGIGAIVKHRFHPFRGVVFDVDPTFSNTEEWWLSIPEDVRPAKDQPYYHVLAENETNTYVAYVSEQNLLDDDSGAPCRHPLIEEIFEVEDGQYHLRVRAPH